MDFLAVGDIVTEPFVRLKDAEVHCGNGTEDCMLSMRFGDKIPYEFAEVVPAVGNAPMPSSRLRALVLQRHSLLILALMRSAKPIASD